MTRVDGWDKKLFATIRSYQDMDFVWGETDCMQFAMACAETVTGSHPYPKSVGAYKTARGAARWLKKNGFVTIRDMLAAVYDEVHPSRAMRGDIGIATIDGEPTALVFAGAWIGRTETGTVRLPSDAIKTVFRVN